MLRRESRDSLPFTANSAKNPDGQIGAGMNYFQVVGKAGFWVARAGFWRGRRRSFGAGRQSGRGGRDESRRVGENQRASQGCAQQSPGQADKTLDPSGANYGFDRTWGRGSCLQTRRGRENEPDPESQRQHLSGPHVRHKQEERSRPDYGPGMAIRRNQMPAR